MTELKNDCLLKVQNLKVATESLLINDFKSKWMIENYLNCVDEIKINLEKLLLMIPDQETNLR